MGAVMRSEAGFGAAAVRYVSVRSAPGLSEQSGQALDGTAR